MNNKYFNILYSFHNYFRNFEGIDYMQHYLEVNNFDYNYSKNFEVDMDFGNFDFDSFVGYRDYYSFVCYNPKLDSFVDYNYLDYNCFVDYKYFNFESFEEDNCYMDYDFDLAIEDLN